MCIEVLVLRTALETKEDNLRHECTCKVQNKRCCPIKNGQHFFHDIKNKQHLFSLFETQLCANEFVQPSPLPILVNNENVTFKISFECNQEEVDTRMIFHASQQKTNVAVCSKDTGVLVLMVFVYALNIINQKQVIKIDINKFINIWKLTSQQSFPKFMQLQGVLQLLFYMFVKIKVLKKCFNGKEKLRLLNTIGVSCKVSDTTVKDV